MSLRVAALFVVMCTTAACAGQPPPMSQVTGATPKAADGSAKVVFLWPPDTCEPGGHQIITTEAGRFIGTVGRGTRLETNLPAGSYTFMTWNPEKERYGTRPVAERVSLLRADVLEGRTYFVRLTFGEWDIRGPRTVWTRGGVRRPPYRTCIDGDATLVRLSPQSNEWSNLRSWLDDLTPIAPDHVAGQRWIDEQPWLVPMHRQLGAARDVWLTREARALSQVAATDGVAVQP